MIEGASSHGRTSRVDLASTPDFDLGAARVRPARRQLVLGEGDVRDLEPRVMQVLVALARAGGEVVSRDELNDLCWEGRIVGDDSINRCILALRRLAKSIASPPFLIETVARVGYSLVVHPTETQLDAASASAASDVGAEPLSHAPSDLRRGPVRWGRRSIVGLALLVMLIGAAALSVGRYLDREPELPTLAVLPFADLSPARNQAHIAEGIAEEILTLLSGEGGVAVLGRSSSWQLRDKPSELQRLGATHLLEGSVRAAGNRVRVAARLVELRSGQQIWTDDYSRSVSDIFEVQEQIGASVAERLRGTFQAAREARQVRATRTKPTVYNLYLSAKAVSRRRSYESVLEAQRLLHRALSMDPSYAPAHAYLAIVHAFTLQSRPGGMSTFSQREADVALRHARTAVELAPRLSEAHLALAMAAPNAAAAQPALERAIELDPGNYQAWNSLGQRHLAACRYRDALLAFERATSIEPLLRGYQQNLVSTLLDLGRPAEAEAAFARFASISHSEVDEVRVGTELNYWTGNIAKAVSLADRGLALQPDDPQFAIYAAYGRHDLGRSHEGARLLPALERGVIGSYWAGDYRRAVTEVARLGDTLWELRFVVPAAFKAMIRAGEHARLLGAVERRWGSVPAFIAARRCDFHLVAPSLAAALRKSGRQKEADEVLSRAVTEHRLRLQNGYAAPQRHATAASLLMMQGRTEPTLSELDKAVAAGWVGQGSPHFVGIVDPIFDPIRDTVRFGKIHQAITQRVSAQRMGS